MNALKNSIAAFAAVAATVGTLAVATPLRAEPVSVAVSYADLDLATTEGKDVLDQRIARAVKSVCGQSDAGTRFEVMACRQKARASAAQGVSIAMADSAPVVLASR